MSKTLLILLTSFVIALMTQPAPADGPGKDMFEVDREDVFEFAQKPQVTRRGDEVTVAFETKGFCDVTVVVEDSGGRIIRHLASGVLGPNAPEPFEKNSKRQTLVWDGKDDSGAYVDDKEAVSVRVSLGLKPQFERTLFWDPGKPSAQGAGSAYSGQRLVFAPAPEGVYVYDSGQGVDHLRLFDHDGDYVRTIYPFPADKMDDVEGLIYHRFPDGVELPIKPNWLQSTFLMSGTNCIRPTYRDGQYRGIQHRGIANGGITGSGAEGIAVANGRIALFSTHLSRIATDGSSGGLNLHGPDLALRYDSPLWTADPRRDEGDARFIRPKRAALSPDGEWLYLTRYNETFPGSWGVVFWRHMVMRIRYDGDGEPEVFVGSINESGDADGQFKKPADVAVDREGRVYVADHSNDRVQVFNPDGEHITNISVRRPTQIDIHHETGEIFVFSWALPVTGRTSFRGTTPTVDSSEANFFNLTKFSPLPNPEQVESWDLQRPTGLSRTRPSNVDIDAVVDTWADPPRVWITARSPARSRNTHGQGAMLLSLKDGEATVERDLLNEAVRNIRRVRPAPFNRQRLYVNHANGMLYLVEGDSSHGKAFRQVVRIDPETGRTREIDLPMSAEDMAFDLEGYAYLRTSDMIIRFQADSWREVPFDYGEERERHHFGSGGSERSTHILSGAMFPGNKGFHQGGMHVSANGNIVVAALYDHMERRGEEDRHGMEGYLPSLYPGRRWGAGQSRLGVILVHIIDRHGNMVYDDAVPGLHVHINGTAIDANNNVYLLNASPIVIDGEEHFNDHAGTLMKFSPRDGRLLASGGAPVPLTNTPDRPNDLRRPSAWVEGAEWMYGGVGWGGHNYSTGCSCPNARFSLDYLARSFTPEVDRYNVGVLDSAGNLILRVGQYGNVDDGKPLVEDGGPPNNRSIGGDETALMFAPYVATHTDHRLYIADPGNARIVSVKLNYHTDEIVSLKDVPDTGAPGQRPE